MTVSTTNSRKPYLGDGVSVFFSTDFSFGGPDEILVIERNLTTGAETTKALTTDYSVAGGNGATGSVTAVVAPPSGVSWTLARNTNPTQLMHYVENDDFPAASHERALDRLTWLVQELKDAIGRSVKLSVTSLLSSITIPDPVPGKFMRGNALGTGLEFVDIAATGGIGLPVSILNGGTGATDAPTARSNLGLGTAATKDVGTGANNLVQLPSAGKLPALDGSALTGITGPVIASGRNVKINQAAAAATFTVTADEVVVVTALGGTAYKLANLSQVVNLAATGAGGMDTGTAPVSGFIAGYAITKADGTKSVLVCNAATSSGSVYAGANMPAGYVASGLIFILPTNASSQVPILTQRDRQVWITPANAVSTAAPPITYTSLSLSSLIPAAAVTVSGRGGSSSSTIAEFDVAADASGTGVQRLGGPAVATGLDSMNGGVNFTVPLITAQTVYYKSVSASNPARIDITGYSF